MVANSLVQGQTQDEQVTARGEGYRLQDPLLGRSARPAGKPSPSPLALPSCSCPVSLSWSPCPGPMAYCK